MGLFSAFTGLFAGKSLKKGATNAAITQNAGIDKAIGVLQGQLDQSRTDFAPYRTGGGAAMVRLTDLIGLNGPEAQATAMQGLRESPLYQSLYRNGEEATLANASATGGLRGGDTQHALYSLGEDTYARTVQDQLDRLAATAGIGIGATNSLSTLGANTAGAIGQGYTAQGDNSAQAILTRAGINAQMWNNAGSFLDKTARSAMPGGGGGGMLGIIKGLFG